MTGDPVRLEAELAEAFTTHRAALRRWLQQAFGRLRDRADDILQDAFAETLCRVRSQAFCPPIGWVGYLRLVARNRAIDQLRSWERCLFRQLVAGSLSEASSRSSQPSASDPGPSDKTPGPNTQLAEKERRGRQGLLLSQVLEQFCRWCESRPDRLAVKEAYERSLRGQQPGEIAAAMQVTAEEVYGLLNRARQWVFQRIRQADVDRSVFLTLHRRKPQ